MGLFLKKNIPYAALGIWEITEPLGDLYKAASLSNAEQRFYASLQSPLRKKHWLSYRLILPHLLKPDSVSGISYDQYGKPHLDNGAGHISVAHSGMYSALITSETKAVGVDIEALHSKIFKIAHKFLSDEELNYKFNTNTTESLYIIWCAKEAMYKLYGGKGLSFKEHMHVEPFAFSGSGEVTGYIKTKGTSRGFRLFYESIDNYLLVYTIDN